VYVLFGPALLVMAIAIVLRVVVFRDRRDWARPLRVIWIVALLVAIVAFLDGMRYACCY
jgi:multisubunit Na+/H+ antiporter MnhB subunit